MNESGTVVVGSVADTGTHPAVWRDGQPVEVLDLFGTATDVNSAGQVVGQAGGPDGSPHAFVYRDGRLRWLPELPGADQSVARAINDHGDVVGTMALASGQYRAVVWPAETPTRVRPLDTAPEWHSDGFGINDSQEIVGRIQHKDLRHGVVWGIDGSVLRSLQPSDEGNRVWGRDIAATGMALGIETTPDGTTRATTWDRAGEPTILPDGMGARAVSVGDGIIGGYVGFPDPFGVVWIGGERIEVPGLSGGGVTRVLAVGDDLMAGGSAGTPSGQVPVTWDCG